MRPLRIVLTCGGTGGHIMPALAVAEELRGLSPPAELLFVGTPDRMEAKLVPAAGHALRTIEISGLQRSLAPAALRRNLRTLLRLAGLGPLRAALRLLREFRPDAVLGTGGYVTGPVLLAAALMRRPTLLLEQNANPGLTNRLLAPVVRRIGLACESQHPVWRKRAAKVRVLGNPVRRQIMEARRDEGLEAFGLESGKRTVACLGGSLGSRALNEAFLRLVGSDALARHAAGLQAVHGCGQRFREEIAARALRVRIQPYRLLDFIERMGPLLAATDLLVCRAGAMTLAEATARGVPMLLVPWEAAANAEQRLNAEPLVRAGAAVLLSDRELEAGALEPAVAELLDEPARLERMAAASRAFGRPEAAKAVVRELLDLAGSRDGSRESGNGSRR
jgi:UDP-N-acetylglucosamine--N-acetylmuramyl-(pentapeptide) pyrophosphoryl-undecaprenol N-acetylglucosamine transferase